MTTLDHPNVRASRQCPLCKKAKSVGLVTCWPCYNEHGLKYGNLEAGERIGEREDELDLEGSNDPENIYGSASIRQSVEEDKASG